MRQPEKAKAIRFDIVSTRQKASSEDNNSGPKSESKSTMLWACRRRRHLRRLVRHHRCRYIEDTDLRTERRHETVGPGCLDETGRRQGKSGEEEDADDGAFMSDVIPECL